MQSGRMEKNLTVVNETSFSSPKINRLVLASVSWRIVCAIHFIRIVKFSRNQAHIQCYCYVPVVD